VLALAAGMLVDVATASAEVTTERTRVKIKMSADACLALPDGTTIRGSGRQKSTTTTTTDAASGITTIVNVTRALGKSRNQDRRRYTFDYLNSFVVSNTAANPAQFVGTMFDQFELVRGRRTTLSNGFVATWTTDLDKSNTYQPLYAFGDPIGFPEGTAHCDPL